MTYGSAMQDRAYNLLYYTDVPGYSDTVYSDTLLTVTLWAAIIGRNLTFPATCPYGFDLFGSRIM